MDITRRDLILSAASALAVAFVPATARPSGLVALVTADLEAEIVAVDPASLRVVSRIPCAAGPRSIERLGPTRAVVAHTGEGLVSLIEGSRLRVSAVIGGFQEPRYAAASIDGRFAYVTDSAAAELVTIDVARARIVGRVAVAGPARHLGLTPDGLTLWTALGTKADRIAVLDLSNPARPRLLRHFGTPFAVHDVAATPEGDRFWISAGEGRRVAIYDRASVRPRVILAADAAPQHIAFAGGVAYVASGDDGTLRAHRLADGRRMWTAAVPTGSYNVSSLGGYIVTPSLSRGTLSAVRPGSRSARSPTVARSAHDVCLLGAAR